MVPQKIIILAKIKLPSMTKLIPTAPESKFKIVIKFGQKFLFIIFIIFCNTSNAQIINYSNEFLQIGASARGIAMGNSIYTTSNDASAIYYNPANLANITSALTAIITHSQYFNNAAEYDFAGFSYKQNDLGIGFGLIHLGIDNIPNTLYLFQNGNFDPSKVSYFSTADNAILLALAKKSKNIANLTYAGKIKIIYRHLGQFVKGYGFGINLSVNYKIKNFLLSGQLRNATGSFTSWFYNLNDSVIQILQNTGNTIPHNNVEISLPSSIFAISKQFEYKKLKFISEFSTITEFGFNSNYIISTKFLSLTPQIGIETNYNNMFFIRFGANNFQKVTYFSDSLHTKKAINAFINFGLGFRYKTFTIDYSIQNLINNAVGLKSHFLSIKFNINRLPKL